MAFQFTLAAVLRLRESLENLERLRLRSLLARRTALLLEVQALQAASRQLREQLSRSLTEQPQLAAQVQVETLHLTAKQQLGELLRGQLLEVQTSIAAQRSRLREEQRKREGLETLRDTQLAHYRQMAQRREQARTDELHLLWRGRRG